MTNFHPAAPIFRVASLAASIDYYVAVLGFEVDWDYPGVVASVSRDQCSIFLSEGDQGNPGAWAWIGVGDAGALFEEYRGKNARIRHPPTNYSWVRDASHGSRRQRASTWVCSETRSPARAVARHARRSLGAEPGEWVEAG